MKFLSDLYSIRMGIAGIAVLIIGLALSYLLVESLSDDLPLWLVGQDVSAQVDESWVERTGENNAGELTFDYFVRYSFSTPQGETISGSSRMTPSEWSQYGEGSKILVTYLPADPSLNRVSDARFVPLLVCSYLPLIIIGLAILLTGWSMLAKGFKKMEPAPWATG